MIDLVIIFLLFILNGAFAMSEMAIVAVRHVRLEARAEAGSSGARIALELARDPSRFLSTVQAGVSLIGIVMGALSTTAVSAPIAIGLRRLSWISPGIATGLAFALGVTITTFLSLIIGELVPKQIALRRPEAIAVAIAKPLSVISRIILPAVALLDATTRLTLKVMGIDRVKREIVSEAEVRTLIDEGMEHGVFHPSEGAMVGRVLRFADRPVRSIMTPRADMVWIDHDASPQEIASVIAQSGHTRLPVGRGTEDEIIGFVHVRDLLNLALSHKPPSLAKAMLPIPAIYEAIPVLQSLEILRKAGARMALVVDEYGGVQGIVTLTDVLEAIVGELPAAGSGDTPEIVEQPDGSLIVEGAVAIEDIKLKLGLQALPGEDMVTTIGGFMLTRLGRVPRVADTIHYAGYSFEVLDMEGRRVGRLAIRKTEASLDDDDGG